MIGYGKCISDTEAHIANVRLLIGTMRDMLKRRGEAHDNSKLCSPEIDYFASCHVTTADTKYGTPEYQKGLDDLRPALNHHYAKNRHHPEHYPNGIKGMNLIDIMEMLCDWKASTMRYKEGNILLSIDVNVKKFGISEDLAQVLRNTAELFELV